MTLNRYINKHDGENEQNGERNKVFGYGLCRLKNIIFSPEKETDLATHIKTLAEQFHGMTRNKCRALIVEKQCDCASFLERKWNDW